MYASFFFVRFVFFFVELSRFAWFCLCWCCLWMPIIETSIDKPRPHPNGWCTFLMLNSYDSNNQFTQWMNEKLQFNEKFTSHGHFSLHFNIKQNTLTHSHTANSVHTIHIVLLLHLLLSIQTQWTNTQTQWERERRREKERTTNSKFQFFYQFQWIFFPLHLVVDIIFRNSRFYVGCLLLLLWLLWLFVDF